MTKFMKIISFFKSLFRLKRKKTLSTATNCDCAGATKNCETQTQGGCETQASEEEKEERGGRETKRRKKEEEKEEDPEIVIMAKRVCAIEEGALAAFLAKAYYDAFFQPALSEGEQLKWEDIIKKSLKSHFDSLPTVELQKTSISIMYHDDWSRSQKGLMEVVLTELAQVDDSGVEMKTGQVVVG